MGPYRTRNVQKDAVRSRKSCVIRWLAGPLAASLPVPPGSDAAPLAYVWPLRLRCAASGSWLLRRLRSQRDYGRGAAGGAVRLAHAVECGCGRRQQA